MNWFWVTVTNLTAAVANGAIYLDGGPDFSLFVAGVSTGMTIYSAAVATARDGWFA